MNIKELLNIYNINARDVKIHMAIGRKTKNEPWVQLTNNNFKNWQENQTKENFKRDYILSFVYLRKNEWLFAGIYTPDSCIKLSDSYQYETTLTKHGLEFIGRLVIFFEKDFRASYLLGEEHVEKMSIQEIHREQFICEPFPGYQYAKISFDMLKQITLTEEYSWKTALSIIKGIYVITDTHSGKLYIGKADGENAIWQRWSSYASSGHGGNEDLIKLLSEKDDDYKSNFQYSILEVLPKSADDKIVDDRESYWKEVFCTRKHGYNKN